MHHVFISYSRKQTAEVSAVVAVLEQQGVPVWIDHSDIPEGVDWERQLDRAVREADLGVCFISDDWVKSAACRSERGLMRHYHKRNLEVPVAIPDFNAAQAAATIQMALDDLPARAKECTDLEVAASAWSNSGSTKKNTARGRDLKRYRATVKAGASMTDTATRFVAASVRASRLRIVDVLIGTLVVGLSTALMRSLPAALEQVSQAQLDSVSHRTEYYLSQAAAVKGPYAALAVALDIPSDDPDRVASYMYVSTLQAATEVDVPVDAGPASETRFSGFVFPDFASPINVTNGTLSVRFDQGAARVELWRDDPVNQLLAEMTVPGKAVAAAFSPDGDVLAVLSDQVLCLIEPVRGTMWRTLIGADVSDADSLAWSPDGRQVGVRNPDDGNVVVWQVLSETRILGRTDLWIMDSTVVGDTGKVAFLGRDGSVAIADASGSDAVEVLPVGFPLGVANAIAADSSGRTLYATVRINGVSQLFALDLDSGRSWSIPLPDGCSPGTVSTSPSDDSRVYVGCGSRIVIVNPDGALVNDVQTEIVSISTMAVSENGLVVAGAEGGGGFFVYSPDLVEQPIRGASVKGASTPVGLCPGGATPQRIRISPDSQKVYVAGNGTGFNTCQRTLTLTKNKTWRMAIPPLPAESASQSRGVAISPDGQLAAIGLSDGSVQVLRAVDSQPGWRWHEQYGEVRGIEFTADSKTIIIGTRDGLITAVPTLPERIDGLALRVLAQQMLDRASRLGLYDG